MMNYRARTSEPSRARQSAGSRTAVLAVLLAIAAAFPFLSGGSLRSFIDLDDDSYVFANPEVTRGLSAAGLRWAFTALYSSNWHPLTWLSHMADCSLFGLDARGHHLTSILIHALTTALLFVALRRLTGSRARSACVAALFGVHPLHVESVAWISERKDVLAGLGLALILLAYERHARKGGKVRYLAVIALFALGLMAKPMLVTVPLLLLLLDLWPLGRALPRAAGATPSGSPWARLLVEKAPLFGLSIASSAITVVAQSSHGSEIATMEALPLGVRAANALVAVAGYVGKTIWPAGLAVYYPHPSGYPPWWRIALATLLVIALTLLALRWRRRPSLAVGWLWFLAMLVPVLGFVQVGQQASADRYTYLPLIGLFIAVSWGVPAAWSSLQLPPRALVGAAALVLVALTAASRVQTGYWKNTEILFVRTLALTRDNWVIHNNLGTYLFNAGRRDEAVDQYRETLRINPRYALAHYNLGSALSALGQNAAAAEHFRTALRLRPDYAEARNNLGNTFVALGRPEEAAANFREALKIQPDFAEAHYNLGNSLAAAGQWQDAAASFREALRVKPDFAEARHNLDALLEGRLAR